nr:phenolic glucoside malonyltransferase 1-like [Ziziphus jujuba var. spinosa]
MANSVKIVEVSHVPLTLLSLTISNAEASVMALQITVFPCIGFCIGIAFHHATTDSTSLTMFMKSWAYYTRSREGKWLEKIVSSNKAKGNSRERKRKINLVLNADYRARLDLPVPKNYFDNYIEKIGEVIKGLENGVLQGAEERLSKWGSLEVGAQVVGVFQYHRFGLYSLYFGWGKPKKMEITSIDRNGAFSLAKSKDGSGGIEIGLVLKKHEMELFGSLFH